MSKKDDLSSFESQVLELIGEASLTWKTEAGNEVFDEQTALRIGKDITQLHQAYSNQKILDLIKLLKDNAVAESDDIYFMKIKKSTLDEVESKLKQGVESNE